MSCVVAAVLTYGAWSVACVRAVVHTSTITTAHTCAWRAYPCAHMLALPQLLPAVATGTMEERSIVEPVRNMIVGKVSAAYPQKLLADG